MNAELLPNPRFTPGATTGVAIGSICSMNDDEVVAPVPGGLQQRVFEEYGIAGAPAANYEVDYLITPGLGGADDIRNLWPEPRYDTEWNSFVKDQLEDYLHHAVCGGRVSLPVAQREIATNWIAAYKKYFHTERPVAEASASIFSARQWTVDEPAILRFGSDVDVCTLNRDCPRFLLPASQPASRSELLAIGRKSFS